MTREVGLARDNCRCTAAGFVACSAAHEGEVPTMRYPLFAGRTTSRLAIAAFALVGSACSHSEEPSRTPAPPTQTMLDVSTATAPAVADVTTGELPPDAEVVRTVMETLNRRGSTCAFSDEEPGIGLCDADVDGVVPLVIFYRASRLYFVSHFLRRPDVTCEQAAPILNDINRRFDDITVLCGQHITFRTSTTLTRCGLSEEEDVAGWALQFRTSVQTILRAGLVESVTVP